MDAQQEESRHEVHEYSFEKLCTLVAQSSRHNSGQSIARKPHFRYLKGYFDEIGTRTIIVEYAYIDRDYLEDFSAYYVRCFAAYERFCTRLHFFDNLIDPAQFDAHLKNPADSMQELLAKTYLGFLVVRPLPETSIGRTCLATYPQDGKRHYCAIRKYSVNLFGAPLAVKSLAFQEQDRVVSACATSALWSVFQSTGIQFQHTILSPVEITRAATESVPFSGRFFPSEGLTSAMMAHAVRKTGLEPLHIAIKDEATLKKVAYAYLRGGMPVLLGADLWDISGDEPRRLGGHAMAVIGFGMDDLSGADRITENFHKASKITKLYVHDDQVGPFARMQMDGQHAIRLPERQGDAFTISTSSIGENGEMGNVRAQPRVLLIPLYHKIRIPCDTIYRIAKDIEGNSFGLCEAMGIESHLLEWDIFLSTVNDAKSSLLEVADIHGDERRAALLKPMPRYLWIARILQRETPLMDLLFDATDIENGTLFVHAIEYDKRVTALFQLAHEIGAIEQCRTLPGKEVFRWFGESGAF